MQDFSFDLAKNSALGSSLAGVRVLAVDDNRDCCDFFTMLFQLYQADIKAVNSASQAFDLFLQFQPEILVIDLAMPAVDGFGLLASIRLVEAQRNLPPTPAIAVTALATPIVGQKAYQAGYQAFFTKPINIDALVAAIAHHTRSLPSCQ